MVARTVIVVIVSIVAFLPADTLAQMDAGLSDETRARCAASPVFETGTVLATTRLGYMALKPIGEPADDEDFRLIRPGTELRLTGPLIDGGTCDYWPVEVVGIPLEFDPDLEVDPCCRTSVGDRGTVLETLFHPLDDPLPTQTECDSSYPDVCIPPGPPDLDCADIPHGDFRVIGPDPHGLDGPYDGSNPYEPDGIGCEWN